MASCSSQKYTAHFPKADGDFGYGEVVERPIGAPIPVVPKPMPAPVAVGISSLLVALP